jgi:sterol 14-demethylase
MDTATDSARSTKLPPMLPGGLPLLGHALELRNDPVGLFHRGRERHGDIFSFRLPGTLGIGMIGPKAHERYFRLSDDDVSQAEAYQLMTPIFGKGIAYDAPPHVFKQQLGFFHDALRESRLKTYAAGFIEEAEHYFSSWADEGVVDFYDVGNELTIYTSSRSLLGNEFRKKLSKEFAELYGEMEGALNLVAFFNPYLPLPSFRRRDRARKRMVELITGIIEQRRREGWSGEDFLQNLMEARYADGRALSNDEITGLLLTIMFAGHHTSGVTFSWTGVLLAQNPHWLARLKAEQKRVLGDRTDLTIEDLRAMHELEWTIKEVLRLYPPLIMLMRKVMNPFEYGGYEVPTGSMIFASPAAAHRIPEVFVNPHRFEPDRFSPERAEDKKHPLGWISFGAGRHRCMGITFAQLQLRALWSHLLRNFDFELMESRYEPDYTRLLVGPRQPCRLRYRRIGTRASARAA